MKLAPLKPTEPQLGCLKLDPYEAPAELIGKKHSGLGDAGMKSFKYFATPTYILRSCIYP